MATVGTRHFGGGLALVLLALALLCIVVSAESHSTSSRSWTTEDGGFCAETCDSSTGCKTECRDQNGVITREDFQPKSEGTMASSHFQGIVGGLACLMLSKFGRAMVNV